MRQYRNCKLDNVCTNLEHLFLCENGLCQNITSAFDCHYTKSQHPVDCKDKRQCITLNGLYECHDGQCAKVIEHCGRFLEFLSKKNFRQILILGTNKQKILKSKASFIISISNVFYPMRFILSDFLFMTYL